MDSPDRSEASSLPPRPRFAEPTQAHLNRSSSGQHNGRRSSCEREREREQFAGLTINDMHPAHMSPHPAQNASPSRMLAPTPRYGPATIPVGPVLPPPGFEHVISPGISSGTPPGIASETLRQAKIIIDTANAAGGLRGINLTTGFPQTQGDPDSLRPMDFDIPRACDRANLHHLATWEGGNQSDNNSGPVVIRLGLDNYLNWSIFINRKIVLNGWGDVALGPIRRTPAVDGQATVPEPPELTPHTPDFVHRQLECSTFILQHVQERYWHMFNPFEVDPRIMLAEIRDVWRTTMTGLGTNRFYLGMEGLEIGQQRVFDYVAQFKWLYESLKNEGASLARGDLYKLFFKGLESRFPGLEYHGPEPDEEMNPLFASQQMKGSLDYMRSYLAEEYKLNAEQQATIVRTRRGGNPNAGQANAGQTNAGQTNAGQANGGPANGGLANGGHANGGFANGGYANGGLGGMNFDDDQYMDDGNGGYMNGGVAL